MPDCQATLLSAIALGSTSRGTRLGARADSAGPLNALATPRSTATEKITGRLIQPSWVARPRMAAQTIRSEEHTSELQSLMRTSYAVFCLKKKKKQSKYKQKN